MQLRTLCPAAALAVALAMPVSAAAPPAALTAPGDSLIQPAAYGDLPTSNAHHQRRKRAATAHDPMPTVPDLHGATREDADKAYRKKYGF